MVKRSRWDTPWGLLFLLHAEVTAGDNREGTLLKIKFQLWTSCTPVGDDSTVSLDIVKLHSGMIPELVNVVCDSICWCGLFVFVGNILRINIVWMQSNSITKCATYMANFTWFVPWLSTLYHFSTNLWSCTAIWIIYRIPPSDSDQTSYMMLTDKCIIAREFGIKTTTDGISRHNYAKHTFAKRAVLMSGEWLEAIAEDIYVEVAMIASEIFRDPRCCCCEEACGISCWR